MIPRIALLAVAMLLGISLYGLYLKTVPPTVAAQVLAEAAGRFMATRTPGVDWVPLTDEQPHARSFITRPGTDHLVFVSVYGVRDAAGMLGVETAARQALNGVAGLEAVSVAYYQQPIRERSAAGNIARPRVAFMKRVLVERGK